jgi:hypothetical protein
MILSHLLDEPRYIRIPASAVKRTLRIGLPVMAPKCDPCGGDVDEGIGPLGPVPRWQRRSRLLGGGRSTVTVISRWRRRGAATRVCVSLIVDSTD